MAGRRAAREECFDEPGHGHVVRTFEQYLDDLRGSPYRPDLWSVAWDGDQLAGLVLCELDGDAAEVPWVAVRPAWRRRGLALSLLDRTHHHLAAAGVTKVRLRTVAENANDTVGLYTKAGYAVTARHPRHRKPVPARA
ncbi:GNAT family N-acetyltransferase [Catellatospora tritici]|uniref:GNAT family N-acetyltransferase n=1 Tax=Catellatospora tritici TaxID=2851566 RepID=UPI001C2D926A|nr:GNAT family N-acetyltransferase [Catellatospora tritici]MBV1850759.1 GNAT family N-acetyltransferase [Catellatospora tritici]MBV1851012.1 GNAT family N-acetyltransferase [Catellatospora tritici]